MEDLLKKLDSLRKRVIQTMDILRVEKLRGQLLEWEKLMQANNFWHNQQQAQLISQKFAETKEEVDTWDNLLNKIDETKDLIGVANNEHSQDQQLIQEIHSRFQELSNEFDKLEFLVLFRGKYDVSNAILSIHAGTGGIDAQDWAQILERMYLRFCEQRHWSVEVMDRMPGNEAGIKSMTLKVSGRWAYGFLKSEAGVHRLVRISPFDAEKMRHTSFALVEVIPELPDTEDMELKDDDLKIDVFRASGPGGQGVNTTDSAVRITHLPTKIVVTCQNERSQAQNKESAIKILKSKLFQIAETKKQEEEARLRGQNLPAEWGNQIRSYVMQPYKMVKDHRTNFETQDIDKVLDGELSDFMEAYLKWRIKQAK